MDLRFSLGARIQKRKVIESNDEINEEEQTSGSICGNFKYYMKFFFVN
jgi:hypothetical protein